MKVDIFNTEKKYEIIYADHPWSYSDKGRRGARKLLRYSAVDAELVKR